MNLSFNRILFSVAVLSALLILLSSLLGSIAVSQLDSDLENIESISAALQNHMQVDQMHDAIRADVNAALLSQSHVTTIRDVRQEFDDHTRELRRRIMANMQLPLNATTRDALRAVGPPLEDYIHNADDIIRLIEIGQTPTPKMLADFKVRFTALEKRMWRVSDNVEQQVGLASHVSKANAAAINGVLSVTAALSVGFFLLAALFQTRTGKGFLTALLTLVGAMAETLRTRWRSL